MNQRLKIEFRHKQLYKDNDPAQPVIVQCNDDGTATYVPGNVPDNVWRDVTDYTEGLHDLNLTWQALTEDYGEGDSTGEGNQFGSNYSKGVSLELRFYDVAFNFIFDWLMTTPCQKLNAVEARITDMDYGKSFRTFELKLDNTHYKPFEEPCIVAMPMRELDLVWHNLQKTIIEDNWQNWFNKDGGSDKIHPTFSMIVEKKPKFYLAIYAALIYIVGMLSVGIITTLNDGKRWIKRTLGFTYFCPAPLIRTYIENFCAKFGYTFETIFDDDPANPYRDLCLFWPVSKTYKNFDNFVSPSVKYIWDNRTVLSCSRFLNEMKKVFNAEWYITPNAHLIFKHKSFFDNQPILYDFTAPGADILWNLEYLFNGKKMPAYGDYQYLIDAQDTCSNELKWRYNDIVDYDGPENNPLLEGHVSKTFDFAMTAFHNDGSSEDFLEEGVKVGRLIAVGALLVGLGQIFAAANPITVAIVVGLLTTGYLITNGYVNNFFDSSDLNGMVRTSSSEVNQPRLLIWDRASPIDRAKVVNVVNPVQNLYYNLHAVDYYQEHPAHDAANYFGTKVVKVYNYPMYVEAKFKDNLFDRFHEYDNPLKTLVVNQDWSGEVDLCCEWLDLLGVWEGDFAKIGATFVIEKRGDRLIKGRLTEFKPDYKTGKISLKGKVLK